MNRDDRLRRRPFGRRLAAMSDSVNATATLGISIRNTKLVVFAVSAGMAGLGGAFFSGHRTGVSTLDFTMLGSLSFLLLATLGGIGHVSGAILGSATLGLIAAVKPAGSEPLQRVLDLGPGLVVVLILARAPDGVAGWMGRRVEPLLRETDDGRMDDAPVGAHGPPVRPVEARREERVAHAAG